MVGRNELPMKVLEAIKNIDWVDVAKRAAWTFAQAFLSVVVLGMQSIIDFISNGDWEGLYVAALALLVAGLAAGFSAFKTVVISVLNELKESAE